MKNNIKIKDIIGEDLPTNTNVYAMNSTQGYKVKKVIKNLIHINKFNRVILDFSYVDIITISFIYAMCGLLDNDLIIKYIDINKSTITNTQYSKFNNVLNY